MKKVISTFLFCLLIAANAVAQPDGPPRRDGDWHPPNAEERAERLAEKLSLDEKQKASLVDIFSAADAEREAIRDKHEQLIHQDMCSHMNSVNTQIKGVLTEEQAAEFDKMMSSRKARFEEHRGRKGKEHGPKMDCGDPDVGVNS